MIGHESPWITDYENVSFLTVQALTRRSSCIFSSYCIKNELLLAFSWSTQKKKLIIEVIVLQKSILKKQKTSAAGNLLRRPATDDKPIQKCHFPKGNSHANNDENLFFLIKSEYFNNKQDF